MAIVYATERFILFNRFLIVHFSNGKRKYYDAITLGCEWFRMSNDAFYKRYGFNFCPQEVPGLYEQCRKLVNEGA